MAASYGLLLIINTRFQSGFYIFPLRVKCRAHNVSVLHFKVPAHVGYLVKRINRPAVMLYIFRHKYLISTIEPPRAHKV